MSVADRQAHAGRGVRRTTARLVVLAGVAIAGIAAYETYGPPRDLGQMEARVARWWPEIGSIERAELARLLSAQESGSPVVLDVREAEEFAVSHIPGAVRISPEVTRDELLRDIGDRMRGRHVVLYCSVGARSALVIRDLGADMTAAGASRVSNLRGGIFGWHNDGRPLVDAGGSTEAIHGFAPRWSRLIVRQSLVGASPVGRSALPATLAQ